MPNDKFICAAPWSHLMLYASGEMATCWASQPYSQEQRSLGQLQSDGIEDLWNNTNIKEVRKAFINGQIPLQCHSCFRLESHNSPSDRQTNFNFDFAKLEEKVKKTEADGSLDCKEVNSLELMLSNVCNFTCRTCNVSNSSAWANEHQFLYKTRIDSPVRRPFQNPDQTANKVFNLAPNIKRLSFIGGEPLIQPEHFKLLNLLIESGKTNVILCYTTNLSELTFRNQDILELWKKFDHIYLTISLDGIRQKGEYIRKGFKWDKFQENLKKINSVLSNINFCCNITVSVLNIFDLREIIEFARSQGISPEEIKLGPVKNPLAYSITILPDEVKKKIRSDYESYRPHQVIDSQIEGVINYMFSRDDSDKLPQFFALNNRLDLLRGETSVSISTIIEAIS